MRVWYGGMGGIGKQYFSVDVNDMSFYITLKQAGILVTNTSVW